MNMVEYQANLERKKKYTNTLMKLNAELVELLGTGDQWNPAVNYRIKDGEMKLMPKWRRFTEPMMFSKKDMTTEEIRKYRNFLQDCNLLNKWNFFNMVKRVFPDVTISRGGKTLKVKMV